MFWRPLIFVYAVMMASLVAQAEEREGLERDIVVNAEADEGEHDQFTELGEYGQPAWAERNHASSTTAVYVLSPYEASLDLFWEGDFSRHGKTRHEFKQEIDVGLLHRFELGFENEVGVIGDQGHETSGTFEIRYALATWNVLPLNPAVSAEYVVGWGKSVESASDDSHHHGDRLRDQPDAAVLRLLLGQDFAGHFGYAMNVALQQDVSDRGRQFQLSHCVTCGLMKGLFEVGAEMRYTHSTQEFRAHDRDDLVIGPTVGWKPTRQTRVNLAPLFGCTSESPTVAMLAMFSYEFGGAEAIVPATAQSGK